MMVRNFLHSCHIACALFLAAMAPLTLAADDGISAAIDRFMASYTRDLAQRLGTGTHIEYNTTSVASEQTCATPLAISARDQGQSLGRVTLLVACDNAWSIYVPVDLDVQRPVVVANKPLANGSVITAADVELSPLNVSQLSGTYLTSLDEAIGMGVKRPLVSGKAVLSQQLEQPLVIRRGDSVMISAESGILAVKMTGIALTDGRRGEQIRIKNQTTSRVVAARVAGPGQVVVPM